MGNKSAI